ncbi:thiamine pyrophosphate-binding protein [Pseudonocardia humida]|uniref:Thiamine pyrophosphate-binding protein n=1 Tax=Pseudonocardia humida TaxID=2800819 RepID=A0ABT0ZZY7_9PSEU|nr:thiamine pyrophosphate-binding protein [Pseudonocardia humida]MCO1656225.1 thiamine pyrophosphate-binding protein [Pseudonocardia humida]
MGRAGVERIGTAGAAGADAGATGTRTGGEAVVDALVALGVRHVFGIPSVHNLPVFAALSAHRDISAVGVRHEQAAAHAADGYARATGHLGVCLTSTGPGAANAVPGLAEAAFASSPVLMITGQVETRDLGRGRGALHEADGQLAMLRTVVRRAETVRRVQDVERTVLDVALDVLTGRPQPGAVEVPIDLQYARTATVEPPPSAPRRFAPPDDVLDRAAELLAAATRPLIWAGSGAVGSGAEVTALAERLGAPVLTSGGGRGAIGEDHPLCVGALTDQPPVPDLVADADVVLAVGTRFQAGPTRRWATRVPRRLLHLDVDPAVIGRNYEPEVALVGDAGRGVAALLDRLGAGEGRDPGWAARAAAARAEVHARLRERMGPDHVAIMEAIGELLPVSGNIVRDATVPAYVWGNRLLPVRRPHTSMHPTWAGIGPGLPLAIGAAVASGEPTVLIQGDGGLMLSVGELATLAQHGLPVVVCVFNDRGYGVLRGIQDAQFGHRTDVDLTTPDFTMMAAAVGIPAAAVDSAARFREEFAAAVRRPGPTLLDVDMTALHPLRMA